MSKQGNWKSAKAKKQDIANRAKRQSSLPHAQVAMPSFEVPKFNLALISMMAHRIASQRKK